MKSFNFTKTSPAFRFCIDCDSAAARLPFFFCDNVGDTRRRTPKGQYDCPPGQEVQETHR